MNNLLINIVEQYGYFAVFLLMALENIIPPIPSDIVLLLSGFLSSMTQMHLYYAFFWATLGSVLGAVIFYYIGTKIPRSSIKNSFAEGTMSKVGFSENDLNKVMNLFYHHGLKFVFIGRFIPVVRSLISIPAGIANMNKIQFFIYTFAGCGIKNGVSIYLGYIAGSNWEDMMKYLDMYKNVFVVIFIILFITFIYYMYRRRQNEEA